MGLDYYSLDCAELPDGRWHDGRAPDYDDWITRRPDGGRGFGFTGGHRHVNWGDPNFRKVVLNALLWIAKAEVPAGGVDSEVSPAELAANLDPKPKR